MTNAYPRKSSWLLWSSLCVALLLALMAPQRAQAQVLYGSIVGNVTDSTGAVVPGTTVTITNKQTNLSRTATTDPAGAYSFIDIQAGEYDVTLTHAGFKTFTKTGVGVTINSSARVDVVLEVGAVTQTVEVTAAVAVLQTETAEVHADLGAVELENLPVPLGRNYQQVYRALPGFSPPQNSHSIPTNPSRALEFNVNGVSDDQNNTRIDGVSTYNIQLPHVNSYVPTLESVQEVNVVTDSFDAEQGMAGGAAINVQTKSGTNLIHGSLFEFNSNNHLRAWPMRFDNAAANAGNKPKTVYNQFGGSVGGPIKKDKLFYFVSYEGTTDRRSLDKRATAPADAMKVGDFSGALARGNPVCSSSASPYTPTTDFADCDSSHTFPVMVQTTSGATVPESDTMIFDPTTGNPDGTGRQVFSSTPLQNAACTDPAGCLNMIPTNRLDPVAQQILGLVPSPNLPGRDFKSNNYFVSSPFAFTRHVVDTKINFMATSKLNFTGTLGVLHYSDASPTLWGPKALGPVISGSGGTSNPGHGHGNTYRTTIMGTYSFTPNFLMDAHFGYAKQGTSSEQPGLGTNIGSDVLGIPGTNGPRKFESGWPEFDIDGWPTVGIDSNFMPYYRHDPQLQYAANFNWMKSKHNIRFGMESFRQALNHTQAEFLSGGYGSQGGFEFSDSDTRLCEVFDPVAGSCASVSPAGISRFNSMGSFVLGLPIVAGRALQVPDVYHVHAWTYSAYARDRWNVTPNLTFDYGVRWEYYPVPARDDRGIERFDNNPSSPNYGKVFVCGIGSAPKDCGIQVSKKLFMPRVGLAYRATNTFVVRAGYGITVDPYEMMEGLRNAYPILLSLNDVAPTDIIPFRRLDNSTPSFSGPSILSPTAFPTGIKTITPPALGNGIIPIQSDFGWEGWPQNFRRGYVESWNFTVQKQTKWGFTGQVGYIGNRSIRQMGFLDLNAGQVLGAGEAGRPYKACPPPPGFGSTCLGREATTVFLLPLGTGDYNGLQASLQRRFTQGLALTVNYTWSKAMNVVDNSDWSPAIQALQYMSMNRAPISVDRTHNLEIMDIWQLPFGQGKRWLSGRGKVVSDIVSGWQTNHLISLISGPPFTCFASGNLNMPGSAQTCDQVKTHVTKTGAVDPNIGFYDPTAFVDVLQPRFGNAGFNSLRGPGLVNWDFGVFREFGLSERWRLQFRAEAFNFTNTPHFDVPDGCPCDGIPGPPGSPNFGGSFMTVGGTINLAREGIDARQFRFGLRLSF